MTIQLPAGTWLIDPSHSEISFWVRHLMVSKVRGSFTQFAGKIITDGKLENTEIYGDIEVSSITTRDEGRDGHLRSPDFFDTEAFPQITFTSKKITKTNNDKYILTGDITIKGITKQIDLETEFNGVVTDPFGQTKALASATGVLNRTDFGLTWNQLLESGNGVLVGEEIHLQLEAQGVLQEN
jgi:polyisoprenoid-binding protein YceI